MGERQRRSKVVAGLAVTLAVAGALLAHGPAPTRAAGQPTLAFNATVAGPLRSRRESGDGQEPAPARCTTRGASTIV
jgi:hypothetical protein